MCERLKQCDYKNCIATGEYRAPKSRYKTEGYFFFCLEHIRIYNQSWDYFKGMSPDEIIEHRISDITWRRPTWSSKTKRHFLQSAIEHPFFEQPIGLVHKSTPSTYPCPPHNSQEFKAIKLLELEYPFSMEYLKKHYLKLVKAYHPDTNAGCKQSEEKLKRITVAYKILSRYITRY
jgi:hypothetical protein